jgi:large subunit ribosomal protein L2
MKHYKPTSAGRRQMTGIDYRKVITETEPLKALTKGRKRDVGRNNYGRLTTRHKGGGHKKLFRAVDFLYNKIDIPAKIASIEYDPNRTAFIGLAVYADGEKRYVILPNTVKVGDTFIVSDGAEVKVGNRLPLQKISVGTFVYNVELKPGNGAKLGRSAGNFVQVIANDSGFAHLKLPSSEVRKVEDSCFACIGEVSNNEHKLVNIGKAGRSRWMGIRPRVRGTAQNPCDHPYGGGEQRQGRGLRFAKTKWGKHVGKGQKSRKPKKYSNRLIVSRRKVGKGKA